MTDSTEEGSQKPAKTRGFGKGEGGRRKGSPNRNKKGLNPRDGRLIKLDLPPLRSAADGPTVMAAVWEKHHAAQITVAEAAARFNLIERMMRAWEAIEQREAERAAKVLQPLEERLDQLDRRVAKAEAKLSRIQFPGEEAEQPKPWDDSPARQAAVVEKTNSVQPDAENERRKPQ